MSIISKNIRVRYPEQFRIGSNSVVDDFSYFSTQVWIGDFCHLAPNITIAGGIAHKFRCEDYCCLASGVRLYCASDDFVNDIATLLPEWATDVKDHVIRGNVIFENFVTIGANSVVMPANRLPDGVAVGALSFVPPNFDFKPWGVYAGNPLRYIRSRNRENVFKQVDEILKRESNDKSKVSFLAL